MAGDGMMAGVRDAPTTWLEPLGMFFSFFFHAFAILSSRVRLASFTRTASFFHHYLCC
jgi:hypothetical protein